MKTLTLILTVGLLLYGCNPGRYCERHFPPVHDTTVITHTDSVIQYKDHIVPYYLPPDTVYVYKIDTLPITVPGKLFLGKTVTASNDFCNAMAWSSIQGRLINTHLLLSEKDTTLQFKLDSAVKTVTYWKSKYTTIHERQVVEKKKKFSSLLTAGAIGFGIGLLIILVLIGLIKLK